MDGTLTPEATLPFLSPLLTPDELAQYKASWAVEGAAASMANWYRANVHPTNRLPTGVTVAVPTLALWGMADIFVPPSQLGALRPFVDDLEVVELPDVGHWVPVEAPDAVAANTRRFAAALR